MQYRKFEEIVVEYPSPDLCTKLESFKEYLISKGWVMQDTKGIYEVLRAVNPEVMKRPLIIYSGRSKEHLSVDNRDFGIVRDYINHREDE